MMVGLMKARIDMIDDWGGGFFQLSRHFGNFFTPKIGEIMIQFDEHIFRMGGEKPPPR